MRNLKNKVNIATVSTQHPILIEWIVDVYPLVLDSENEQH